ncbi:MAG TPA: hypothetical protein VLX28_22710 [Thermoanaerobaculia bacterium]|nr:hypothetical protein [Thermoanaerobaculia bacterium]
MPVPVGPWHPRNSIYNLSLTILEEARRTGRAPARVAFDLAEERSFDLHPLWGHRGAAIIQSLVRSGKFSGDLNAFKNP